MKGDAQGTQGLTYDIRYEEAGDISVDDDPNQDWIWELFKEEGGADAQPIKDLNAAMVEANASIFNAFLSEHYYRNSNEFERNDSEQICVSQ